MDQPDSRDGSLTVTFPDGTVKRVGREGEETVQFTDGTLITLRCGSCNPINTNYETSPCYMG